MIEIYLLLYIGSNEIPHIPSQLQLFDYKFIKIINPEEALSNPDFTKPDIILIEFDNKNYNAPETIFRIKSKWRNIPVFTIVSDFTVDTINKAYNSGAYDVFKKPVTPEALYNLLLKCGNILSDKSISKLLSKHMIKSENSLLEKTTVLQTILDILSHDSKNIFINLKTLISQLAKNPIRSMLEDCVNELYENLMESICYLKSKKRIFSIVDLLNDIKITSERIPLPSHSSIKIVHDSRYLMFVETTRLIKNAIMNIIENALKYSEEEITIIIKRKNENIMIHIADRGRGIPDEDKTNIFKRNYRRSQSMQIEGSGKGLWITSNIINNENGELAVSDNPGGGTVFTIKLPAFKINNLETFLIKLSEWYDMPLEKIKSKASAVETVIKLQEICETDDITSLVGVNLLDSLRNEKKENNQKHFQRKLKKIIEKNKNSDRKILIIDDSIYVHYYLASHLTDMGYGIAGFARNGIEGIKLFKQHKPDIITCDMTMPVISGIETARRIYEIDKNAKIIFITALGESLKFKNNLNEILPDMEFNILTKPIKKRELENILKRITAH